MANCSLFVPPIHSRVLRSILLTALAPLGLFVSAASAQGTDGASTAAVRVTMSVNEDGTRTVYQFDTPQHKATARTMGADGKLRSKIDYVLDDADRFLTGDVYGAKGVLQFKARYKYDAAGRLMEEVQLSKDDTLQHRIVYAYDEAGKQTGYSIYDSAGRLISRTGVTGSDASTPVQPARRSSGR
ncbi:MAG: hypothetical protein ABI871_07695 [Chthoniobacterales bacterium]